MLSKKLNRGFRVLYQNIVKENISIFDVLYNINELTTEEQIEKDKIMLDLKLMKKGNFDRKNHGSEIVFELEDKRKIILYFPKRRTT